MNLLFFSPYYLPYISGITMFPARLLSHIAKKNSVTVLTFPHHQKLPREEIIDNVTVRRLPYICKVSKGFISPQSLWIFFEAMRKAEVVILNLPSVEGLPLALWAKLFRKPVISIFHCQVFLGKGFCNWCVEKLLHVAVICQLHLSNVITATTLDYVQSLSWYTRSFMRKTKAILPPVETLPVNQQKYKAYKALKGMDYWVGFVGRIAREKGLEYVIEALQALTPRLPLSFVVAGPSEKEVVGEMEYADSISRKIKASGIVYHHFGKLKTDELGAFYKALDVLVVPSVNRTEALSLVQIEAMLLGTPVIASDLPGLKKPIQLTGMGILVPPRQTAELKDALLRVCLNASFPVPSSSNAIEQLGKPEIAYMQYDQLLREVVNS